VEKFLDTPVKRYSSGMYVRLAFAVAAHLEPEILVVDEVLSVGDVEFQKKCLGKMQDVAGHSRTVLFVSHNLGALERICRRGILLDGGRKVADASIRECIDIYQRHHTSSNFTGQLRRENARRLVAFIQTVTLRDELDRPTPHLRTWGRCAIELEIVSSKAISDGSAVIYISSSDNRRISLLSTKPDSGVALPLAPGVNKVRCEIPRLFLSAGTYSLGAGIAVPNVEWIENEARLFDFDVVAQDVFHSGLPPTSERYLVPMPHTWHLGVAAQTCQEPVYER
jgi:lipopolysaccharide transport system ATP-binding protein